MDPLDFTLCTKRRHLAAAVEALRNASTIFLDCEGTQLGCQGGRLSLISLGVLTPHGLQVYLIDAHTLGQRALRPIFDLLKDNTIVKVVFDGRMDQSALFYGYGGILMENIVDLQLVELKSRVEKNKQHLMRLSPYVPRKEVRGNKHLYSVVQKLSGLGQVAQEHQQDSGGKHQRKKGKRQPMKAKIDHSLWCTRPLPGEYLAYAAKDIYLIHDVWSAVANGEYIDEEVAQQSLRYVRMWTQGIQPATGDAYKLHPLLPLGILTHASGDTKRCIGCERHLSEEYFSSTAWKQSGKCLVCRAVGAHLAG
ncbi:ribonuclease H-like domain-containing protein [Mycena crocata]|nr:ribonuclease H-like domain-containing protein [Mycena crocata]